MDGYGDRQSCYTSFREVLIEFFQYTVPFEISENLFTLRKDQQLLLYKLHRQPKRTSHETLILPPGQLLPGQGKPSSVSSSFHSRHGVLVNSITSPYDIEHWKQQPSPTHNRIGEISALVLTQVNLLKESNLASGEILCYPGALHCVWESLNLGALGWFIIRMILDSKVGHRRSQRRRSD